MLRAGFSQRCWDGGCRGLLPVGTLLGESGPPDDGGGI
jgi:hypothetical protein